MSKPLGNERLAAIEHAALHAEQNNQSVLLPWSDIQAMLEEITAKRKGYVHADLSGPAPNGVVLSPAKETA